MSSTNNKSPYNLEPRQIGKVNGRGLWTLYTKEVQRFMSVWLQTIMAPVVTTLLFLAIFSLALGGAVREINGMPFILFLAPGLLAMAVAQNSFANTSSSIIVFKIQGNIVDVLVVTTAAVVFAVVVGRAKTVTDAI